MTINGKRRIKTIYTNRARKKSTSYKPKNKKPIGVLKFLLYSIIVFIIIGLLGTLVLYKKYISDLPSVTELENLDIAEASTIYDREGNELYKIFKEKRTYIEYDMINKNMVNAIVAGEDKTFFENPGVDLKGIIRAVFNYVTGKTDSIKGTSTLSQQLIRNTIIANRSSSETFEEKIARKVKEVYLSYKMNAELSKEKILELYLNKISFGSNAFGIEQASQTFFGKSASDLGILQASILASLPKGPTYYSPYNHADRLLGYPYIYNNGDEENVTKILSFNDEALDPKLVLDIRNFIENLKAKRLSDSKVIICGIDKSKLKNDLKVDNDNCAILDYSDLFLLLNSIKISGEERTIEYEAGRKDFILGRMLEDQYIEFDDYKSAILDSFSYKFSAYKENIDHPHFVFYIKEYLEEKYPKESIEAGGLKIYTTLDPDLQKKAEELVEEQSKLNLARFDASNAALISIDNKNGDILAMVGGNDYFDIENKGNVNITTSPLQPGSTFKPFVYSMGIFNEEIGSKTPIYDLETNFPNYKPANFDGEFMGKMNISSALNNSRNIPAIKMFYLAGGENNIVGFMKKLGVKSLREDGNYGAPLALGTGEMTPLELAGAYSVFANMGKKVEINPIQKIVDSRGNIVEEKNYDDIELEETISSGQAYIINHILSDSSTRPEGWNSIMTLKGGRKVAVKTGTSTKQYNKGGGKQIYPRNLWTAGYTPQYTTVVWAGNTSGQELNYRGNGLEGAGPIWQGFMNYIHEGKRVESWNRPSSVKQVNISNISGLLPSPELSNNNFIVSSLFLNPPEKYDNSLRTIKVDMLCKGKVTEKTPEAAIREITLLEFHSLSPDNPKWEGPVQEWVKSDKMKELYGNIPNIVTSINLEECNRDDLAESNIEIASTTNTSDTFVLGENYIELAYRSSNPIRFIDILLGDTIVDTIEIGSDKKGVYRGNINVSNVEPGEYTLKIRAVDSLYFSNEERKNIILKAKDKTPPKIEILNPIDLSIKLYKDEFFNLRGKVTDRTPIRTINIYVDGEKYEIGIKDREFVREIHGEDLSLGEHTITVSAIDNDFNTSKVDIRVEVIEK